MKNSIFAALFCLSLFGTAAHAARLNAQKDIYCRADGENGNWMVTISPRRDGTFIVNEQKGGTNGAEEGSNRLELSNLGFFCNGANASLDLGSGSGTIEYKYDSGVLGGGCQHMKGALSRCNNEAWPQ